MPPATFLQAMNTALNELNWKDCLVNLDEVLYSQRVWMNTTAS